MRTGTIYRQVQLTGASIEVDSMARGEIKLITIFQPSKETSEALNSMDPGDTINCIELNQHTVQGPRCDQYTGKFEVLASLTDRLHGPAERHLLVREAAPSHEEVVLKQKNAGAYLHNVPAEDIFLGMRVRMQGGPQGVVEKIEPPSVGTDDYEITVRWYGGVRTVAPKCRFDNTTVV